LACGLVDFCEAHNKNLISHITLEHSKVKKNDNHGLPIQNHGLDFIFLDYDRKIIP
jgi:hypothetical protein